MHSRKFVATCTTVFEQVQDVEGKLPPKVALVVKVPMTPYQSAIYNWVKVGGTTSCQHGPLMMACCVTLRSHLLGCAIQLGQLLVFPALWPAGCR